MKPFSIWRKAQLSQPVSTTLKILNEDTDPHIGALAFAKTVAASYGQEVAKNRALPDLADGLLPVHRRIIYACHRGNFIPSKPPRKTSKVIGDVIGDFHPHGETSISGAITTLTRTPIPIMDGTISAFASPFIQGSMTASPRYTETRLTKFGETFVHKGYLPMMPVFANYDDTQVEPPRLPALLPNILLTRLSGVAFGISTDVPPFTLESVYELLALWLDKGPQSAQVCAEILRFNYLSQPELVSSTKEVAAVFAKGRGSLKFTPRFLQEPRENLLRLVACPPDLPYTSIVDKISAAGIDFAEIQDQSTSLGGFDIHIRYKRGQNGKALEEKLRDLLTKSVRIRWVVTDRKSDTHIEIFATNLPNLISRWLVYRLDLEEKVLAYQQDLLSQDAEKQKLLLFAFAHREALKKVWDEPDPQRALVKTLKMTPEQAAILCSMPVKFLFKLQADKVQEHLDTLMRQKKALTKKQMRPAATLKASLSKSFSEFIV